VIQRYREIERQRDRETEKQRDIEKELTKKSQAKPSSPTSILIKVHFFFWSQLLN
jgi:hypothetical protein